MLLFCAMDNEKLIEFVREYKYLYDLSDKRYSDNQKKDQAWNEIGIKLQRDGKYPQILFYIVYYLVC